MSKERRLGRGLEALLGRAPQPKENPAAAKPTAVKPTVVLEEEKPAAVSVPTPDVAKSEKPDGPMDASGSGIVQQNYPAPLGVITPPATQTTGKYAFGDTVKADLSSAAAKENEVDADNDLVMVNVALIEANPFQPRKQFDDASMDELAESIAAHGLLQPIVARRVDDVYQLIAGERRLRAAQKAGWEEVPVRVIETDERGAAELAIVENLQRKDLNALEKAASFKRYLKEHRCTQGQLANRLKIDRSTIANLIRLLELPEEVQNAVAAQKISQGHARALLPLGEEREQVAFCQRIQRDGLSVRKTETLVQEAIKVADAEPLSLIGRDGLTSRPSNKNEHLASLEQEFRLGLGTKVKITQGKGGRGKLVIQFKNHEEFNRVKEHILGPKKPQSKAG